MTATTATTALPESTTTGRHRSAEADGLPVRHLFREQAIVVGGQLTAGIGNMVFSLLAARSLPSTEFAHLATFLALYLLLLVPSSGLAAAAAANPGAVRLRWVGLATIAIGAALAAAGHPIGAVLHLQPALVMLLGAALPAVTVLAVERGRLYGMQRHTAAVGTLVAEPVVRLAGGAVLLSLAGAVGAAVAVVAGGYVALLIAFSRTRRRSAAGPEAATLADAAPRPDRAMIAAFVAMSVMQNLDVILANRLLASGAGTFAAVSTLGGIAAFATATVPLVLLPRARPGAPDGARALGVAVAAVVALGGAAVTATAVATPGVYAAVLGPRYAHIAAVAVPYVAAMALFGFARVLAARLCAHGLGRVVVSIVWGSVTLQALWILLAARTPGGVATGTEVAVTAGAAALGVTQATQTYSRRRKAGAATPDRTPNRARAREPIGRRDLLLLVGLVLVAAGLRLAVTRGLWVDEATSVAQANMSFGGMLRDLRTSDVHPPGYFSVLWVWVRMFGDGELAVRFPSILFGIALVPAVYGAAREMFDRRTARIAAIFTVIAPQAVWYSQEARMYSLFMLLVVLAVWAQARIVRTGSWGSWLGYTAATVGLLYTQYFTTLVVVAQQVIFLVLALRARRRGVPLRSQVLRWAVSSVLVLAAVAPLVPFVWHQFAVNQAAGKGFGAPTNTGAGASSAASGPSVYSLLANLVWLTVGYHSDAVMTELGAAWPLVMLLLLALLGRGRSARALILGVVAVLPITALFVLGQAKSFVFDMRYFIGAVPLFVLLMARAVAKWPLRRVGVAVAASVVAAALAIGLWDQQLNGENPRRYDFSPALQATASAAGPRSAVVLSPSFLDTVSRYYQPQLHYVLDEGGTSAVARKVNGTRQVFVLGSFFANAGQRQHTDDLVRALAAHRHVVRVWKFDNVKVWELR